MNSHPVLRYVIEVLGVDNVTWAIDYPFQAAPGSVEFMNTAPVSNADRRKLFQGNAADIPYRSRVDASHTATGRTYPRRLQSRKIARLELERLKKALTGSTRAAKAQWEKI